MMLGERHMGVNNLPKVVMQGTWVKFAAKLQKTPHYATYSPVSWLGGDNIHGITFPQCWNYFECRNSRKKEVYVTVYLFT